MAETTLLEGRIAQLEGRLEELSSLVGSEFRERLTNDFLDKVQKDTDDLLDDEEKPQGEVERYEDTDSDPLTWVPDDKSTTPASRTVTADSNRQEYIYGSRDAAVAMAASEVLVSIRTVAGVPTTVPVTSSAIEITASTRFENGVDDGNFTAYTGANLAACKALLDSGAVWVPVLTIAAGAITLTNYQQCMPL